MKIAYILAVLAYATAITEQPPGKPPSVPQPSTAPSPAKPRGTFDVVTTAGAVTCTLRNTAYAAVDMRCSGPGVDVAIDDVEPGFNLRPLVGHFTVAGDTVKWELSQKPVGTINYTITANGTAHTGHF